jgi:hypothetical protein
MARLRYEEMPPEAQAKLQELFNEGKLPHVHLGNVRDLSVYDDESRTLIVDGTGWVLPQPGE